MDFSTQCEGTMPKVKLQGGGRDSLERKVQRKPTDLSAEHKANLKKKRLGIQQLGQMRMNRDLAPHAEMLNNDTAR